MILGCLLVSVAAIVLSVVTGLPIVNRG